MVSTYIKLQDINQQMKMDHIMFSILCHRHIIWRESSTGNINIMSCNIIRIEHIDNGLVSFPSIISLSFVMHGVTIYSADIKELFFNDLLRLDFNGMSSVRTSIKFLLNKRNYANDCNNYMFSARLVFLCR